MECDLDSPSHSSTFLKLFARFCTYPHVLCHDSVIIYREVVYVRSGIQWSVLLFFYCPYLPQVPEYAVLEKDSAPMPISTSLRSSASPTPPPLPPPLSTSPPSSSPPPPPSFPPPSPSKPPPVYSEIPSLPQCQSAAVNQYMEIQSAGTTIY